MLKKCGIGRGALGRRFDFGSKFVTILVGLWVVCVGEVEPGLRGGVRVFAAGGIYTESHSQTVYNFHPPAGNAGCWVPGSDEDVK